MPGGGTDFGSLIYSIQRTYILKVDRAEGEVLTCDQRIDIPTIEPLPYVEAVVYNEQLLTVVPCIELTGARLDGLDLTFETNEGATVLPVKISSGVEYPLENPYLRDRYVLVLPRGTTGIKTCKATLKETGANIQHNFTFGILPPPYNYDNALFGYISYRVDDNSSRITALESKTDNLKIVTSALKASFPYKELPKNSGKQTVNIEKGMLYFSANFTYISFSSTEHSPKITVSDGSITKVYTLSLDDSVTVTIDLLAGTITAYVSSTGKIVQQLKIFNTVLGYKTIAFEDFDDIAGNTLTLLITGRCVE